MSDHGFPLEEAKLVSLLVQSVLFGIYCLFFLKALLAVWLRRKITGVRMGWLLSGTSLTMWVIAAMHLGVNFAKILEAFIVHRDDEDGPGAYLNRLNTFQNLAGCSLYLAQTLIADSVLLGRATIVWGLDWRLIAFPFLLYIGSFASAIGMLVTFARAAPGVIFQSELTYWDISFVAQTLATNLICTTLIATKIWTINRYTALHVFENKMFPIFCIIVESGAIYPCAITVLMTAYLTGSNICYIMFDAVTPLLGIVFSVLIIQLGVHFSEYGGAAAHKAHVYHGTLWNTPLSGTDPPA